VCEVRHRRGVGAVVEQLRDAEVDELHLAVVRHQDVRRLDVAMENELAVRMRDGSEDIEEQPDARGHVESAASRTTW
jgi:hypothetical protein